MLTVSAVGEVAAISAGCALAVGLLVWGLSRRLRRRSLRASMLVLSVLCLGATLAAVVGTAQAMFLSRHDLYVTMVVAVVAATTGLGAALRLSRLIAGEHDDLRAAAARLGAGGDPAVGRSEPLAAEIEQVRRALVDAGQALAQSRQREVAMAGAQQDLVTAMSHDLRTPMARIRAMAEALEDGVAADPAAYHAQIRADVDRLTAMVEALFDLTRTRDGTADPTAVPVSLHDLVSDCLAGFDALARSRSIRLSGRAGAVIEMVGDPTGLGRALDNVVANALAATPRDGAVTVVLDRVTAPLAAARIAVTDTCGGIPARDLDRVFDVGFRGRRPEDRARAAPGGAGLGLAVARRIVEAHHGTITASSTDAGCTFTIVLPLA